MYQIRAIIRYVFRFLAIFAAAVAVLIVACSLAVPYLVEGRAVRASLVRNLSSWSGGQVVIKGPVRVASLIALTIEAQDVHLSQTGRISPVRSVDARSVRAIASISGLLRGRLEFKKVIVISPKFVLERSVSARFQADPYGLETMNIAFALAGRSPFSDLVLRQSVFFAAGGARKPFKAFFIPQIRLTKPAAGPLPQMAQARKNNPGPDTSGDRQAGSPFHLWIKGEQFVLFIRGALDAEGDSVVGNCSMTLAPADPAAERIKDALLPWEKGSGAVLSGELTWSPGRLSVDNALISFGDHNAKGSLSLTLSPERRLLEGTLAYDVVDFTSMARAPDGNNRPEGLDLDMRISAERVRAGGFEAGPFAVALTSKRGRISADIAELGLFGGTVSGRVDRDLSASPALSVSASGWRVDAASLSQALALPLRFTGTGSFNLNLAAPLATGLPELLSAASGSFKVSLPNGAAIDGNVSPSLRAALTNHDAALSFGERGFSFSRMAIDGTIKDGGMAAEIDGQTENTRVAGSFQVALPNGALHGRLSIKDVSSEADTAIPAHLSQDQDSNTLLISGTATAPSFSLPPRHSLSN
jgi:AsmA protein